MDSKNKINFTTRPWGFGSNIVNLLKSIFFCSRNNLQLILQDRYNTIGEGFKLFSVVELPDFIERVSTEDTAPIHNFKTLIKFIIDPIYGIKKKIVYTIFFLTGTKTQLFIKNFNSDFRVNDFFDLNYNQKKTDLTKYWVYTKDVRAIFSEYDELYGYMNYKPDLAIQIRGGDKIQEVITEGFTPAIVSKYIDLCTAQLLKINKPEINMYVMTDTFSYYILIKTEIEQKFSNVKVRSLAIADQEGYTQAEFNLLPREEKIRSYHFFLYELEMLRKSTACVGSFTSNIFLLGALTKYDPENIFLSVDLEMKESFV